ncbi:hypothetical protein GCM10027614_79450 [Micromonospora vulcania]
MTFAYDLPAHDNDVLAVGRLVFGSVMAVSIVLGLAGALRRHFAQHRRWMVRGYAIGLGAGTQAFTNAPYLLATGEQPDGNVRAGLVIAGWVINLAVAEWYLRRPARTTRSRRESGSPSEVAVTRGAVASRPVWRRRSRANHCRSASSARGRGTPGSR